MCPLRAEPGSERRTDPVRERESGAAIEGVGRQWEMNELSEALASAARAIRGADVNPGGRGEEDPERTVQLPLRRLRILVEALTDWPFTRDDLDLLDERISVVGSRAAACSVGADTRGFFQREGERWEDLRRRIASRMLPPDEPSHGDGMGGR
jgi:hypothetical protein